MDMRLWPFHGIMGISPKSLLATARPLGGCGTCVEVACIDPRKKARTAAVPVQDLFVHGQDTLSLGCSLLLDLALDHHLNIPALIPSNCLCIGLHSGVRKDRGWFGTLLHFFGHRQLPRLQCEFAHVNANVSDQ